MSMTYKELLDFIESPNSFSYEYNSQKDNSSKPSKEYSSEEPSDNSGKSKSKKYCKYLLYVLLFLAITFFMFVISVFIETMVKYAFVCPTILVSWIAFKLIYKFSPKIKDKLLNVVNFNILLNYKPLKTITVIALLFASALSIYPKTNFREERIYKVFWSRRKSQLCFCRHESSRKNSNIPCKKCW